MEMFARCFLLVFAELYVGGLLALSIPPFHQIERGFYKSTASVYLGAGSVAFAGRVALLLRGPAAGVAFTWAEGLEMLLWGASLTAAGLYLRGLWGEAFRARARHYVWAWTSGVAALALGAQAFRLGPLLSVEAVLYPLSFIVAALLLGAVTTGMLLGHWYLIDPNLPVDYLRTIVRLLGIALIAELGMLFAVLAIMGLLGGHASTQAVATLFDSDSMLLGMRLILGPVASITLFWMTWQTLKIPQTMAATGLLYIAVMSVLVGELMGRFILFRTALPL